MGVYIDVMRVTVLKIHEETQRFKIWAWACKPRQGHLLKSKARATFAFGALNYKPQKPKHFQAVNSKPQSPKP